MKKTIFYMICFFALFTTTKADQNEANLYMQEIRLVFGDKHCEKVLEKYVFNGCHYNDYKKGEHIKLNHKRMLERGTRKNKCLNLLAFRKACILKHERNSTAEIKDFVLENK